MSNRIRRMVFIATIASMSFIIAKATRFPIFPTAPFLKMEFGEIPLMLLTAFTSWKYGLLALLMKEVLGFTLTGGPILSYASSFIACGTWLLIFDIMYKKNSKLWLTVIVGGIIRAMISIPVNLVVLPLLYGSNIAVIISQLVWILPFNFLKVVLGGACFKVLYPKLVKPLGNTFLVFEEEI